MGQVQQILQHTNYALTVNWTCLGATMCGLAFDYAFYDVDLRVMKLMQFN